MDKPGLKQRYSLGQKFPCLRNHVPGQVTVSTYLDAPRKQALSQFSYGISLFKTGQGGPVVGWENSLVMVMAPQQFVAPEAGKVTALGDEDIGEGIHIKKIKG
jgi:hypothetical protein